LPSASTRSDTTFIPPSTVSIMATWLFGVGPGVYLDFAVSSFQVPAIFFAAGACANIATVEKTSSIQTLIKARLITFSLTADIGTNFAQHVPEFGTEAASAAEPSETKPSTRADESARLIERQVCDICKKSGG